MSILKLRIQDDMKDALRTKDAQRLGTIRMILAAVKQVEVDERIEVSDKRLLKILATMCKQRLNSIEYYQQASRQDLVEQERFELQVIQTYMPIPS